MVLQRSKCTLKELKDKLLPIIGDDTITFYVYVNLITGEILLLKKFVEKDNEKFKFLGVASGSGKELISNLKNVIFDYNKLSKMTKTEVIKKFGKKGIMDCAYICTLSNPFYKCAGNMTWYDKYVIRANIKKNETV